MNQYKIHIDENLPDKETINKYKKNVFHQANPSQWYRYEGIKKLFKSKKALIILATLIATGIMLFDLLF